MPRYFFDIRNGDELIQDAEGVELDDVEAARTEAAAALRDMAKDAIPKSERRQLAIEVRDESERQLIRAALWIEVRVLA